METASEKASFWEHLDALRGVLLRSLAVTFVFSLIAFVLKDQLFSIVFAPKSPDFITYRLIDKLGALAGVDSFTGYDVRLINTGLALQFMVHMKTALCAGVLCASPYIVFQLFSFIAPALYRSERKYAVTIAAGGYLMFVVGVIVSYLIIFPVTFQFLGTYQVAADVTNMIDLNSYMSTLIMMCLCMGIVFEMPVVAYLLGLTGLLESSQMSKYRRHAIVVILIVAAIITPTSDAFTLAIVSLPMWLLYEVSILLVRKVSRRPSNSKTKP